MREAGVVLAGERMQVCEPQAAPRRAQDGEPRRAVRQVQESAGEGEEIEDFLPLGKWLDLDRAVRDLRLGFESFDEVEQVSAGADEHGDPRSGRALEPLRHHFARLLGKRSRLAHTPCGALFGHRGIG